MLLISHSPGPFYSPPTSSFNAQASQKSLSKNLNYKAKFLQKLAPLLLHRSSTNQSCPSESQPPSSLSPSSFAPSDKISLNRQSNKKSCDQKRNHLFTLFYTTTDKNIKNIPFLSQLKASEISDFLSNVVNSLLMNLSKVAQKL